MTPRLLAAAAALWALLLPAAAYAASGPHGSGASRTFALAIYTFGSAICHQRVERSFHLFGVPLAVCARCTGIYVGAALTAAMFVGAELVSAPCRAEARSAPARHARVMLLLGVLPTVLTLVYEWTTGIMPSNIIRAAAGVVLGAAVALVVLKSVKNQVN